MSQTINFTKEITKLKSHPILKGILLRNSKINYELIERDKLICKLTHILNISEKELVSIDKRFKAFKSGKLQRIIDVYLLKGDLKLAIRVSN